MQTPQDIKNNSIQSSQDYSTRLFLFALELIPYFGVPAIIGYVVNRRVEEMYPESGILPTVAIFFSTYLCSWIIVIARYRSITRKMKQ